MFLFIFLFAAFATPMALAASSGMVYRTRLENFYQCPNHPNTPLVIKDTYIKRVSPSETRLFGKMVVQGDVEDFKGKLEMSKCASKSEPDTCEYYTTIQYEKMCTLLKQKTEPWYGYFNSTTMPITCPFPKGAWEMKGIKIGLSSAFPLLSGFWRFKNRCYGSNKKLQCCFIMEMTVISHFGKNG